VGKWGRWTRGSRALQRRFLGAVEYREKGGVVKIVARGGSGAGEVGDGTDRGSRMLGRRGGEDGVTVRVLKLGHHRWAGLGYFGSNPFLFFSSSFFFSFLFLFFLYNFCINPSNKVKPMSKIF
jgi:hypothetical protein